MEEFLRWNKYIDIFILIFGSLTCLSALIKSDKHVDRTWSYLILIAMVFLLGCFPICAGLGTDKENYAMQCYSWFDYGFDLSAIKNDPIFSIYQWLSSSMFSVRGFFLLTAFIYVYNHYKFSNIIENNGFFLFASFILSFSFVPYGVNTIRAGLAASFILVALCNNENRVKQLLLLAIAVGIHFSMIIPVLAFLIARRVENRKMFYLFWILSIPISFIGGSFFETLFAGIGVDERVDYLVVAAESTHYNVGFRFDFIIYSAMPVFASYYYVCIKKIEDVYYEILSSTYLIANIFWILVIRANFSDRFAYLSWFLYPVILLYPVLKSDTFIDNKSLIVGGTLLFLLIFRMII